jgi:hypothetical protein
MAILACSVSLSDPEDIRLRAWISKRFKATAPARFGWLASAADHGRPSPLPRWTRLSFSESRGQTTGILRNSAMPLDT